MSVFWGKRKKWKTVFTCAWKWFFSRIFAHENGFSRKFVLEGVFPQSKPKHWSVSELQNLFSRKDQNPIHGRSFFIPKTLTQCQESLNCKRLYPFRGHLQRFQAELRRKIKNWNSENVRPYFRRPHYHPACTGERLDPSSVDTVLNGVESYIW